MRATLQVLCECRRYAKAREDLGGAVLETSPQNTEFGATNTRGVLEYSIEHRLKLAGRRTDHAQHFGGRRLLLQRFREVVCTVTQLVEQPRVLDGDDGLGSEASHQLDLLVGERANFLTVNANCTE